MKESTNRRNKNNHMIPNSETLRRAADLADEIAAKQAELGQLLGGGIESAPASPTIYHNQGQKRRFTPESINRIREAQRRRWRAVRKLRRQQLAVTPATTAVDATPATETSAPAVAPPQAEVAAPTKQKKGKSEHQTKEVAVAA